MAKLVVKCGYIKAGENAGYYARYIGTREGVELPKLRSVPVAATAGQEQLIDRLLRDYPQSKEMLEYEDYLKDKTVGNASEFIARALEDYVATDAGATTYTQYIATRPRAERVGKHGLFSTQDEPIDLDALEARLNHHQGNVWTVIVSLRREDAQRLGFDSGKRWRDMLRTQTQTISESLKISIDHLHWYAAFHDESYHPHIHMVVFSDDPQEGFLKRQGIRCLKASFAKDIFQQELFCIYDKQTGLRDELRQSAAELAEQLAQQILAGSPHSEKMDALFLKLARALHTMSGRKQYAYLKPDVKQLVDDIVAELGKDERIAKLYDLWYEQREKVLEIYNKELPARIPLQACNEFRTIKNAVIRLTLQLDKLITENMIPQPADSPATEPSSPSVPGEPSVPSEPQIIRPWEDADWLSFLNSETASVQPDEPIEPDLPNEKPEQEEWFGDDADSGFWIAKKSWWTDGYIQARRYLYGTELTPPDFGQALALMKLEAGSGNGFAMHDFAKMQLLGLGCDEDGAAAQKWFEKAYHAFVEKQDKVRKKGYLQYRIGKLYASGYGVEQDYAKAAAWYKKAGSENNPFAAYALGSLYRRGLGVEQDDVKACALYRIAAEHPEKPNAYAAYELGRMCRYGIGTEQDEAASNKWYRQAYKGFLAIKESGFADDKLHYRLGQMNLTGSGTDKNVRLAIHFFENAAKNGNPFAELQLGKLYLYGTEGIERDRKKALEWLDKAAEHGNANAQEMLDRIHEQNTFAAGLSVLRLFQFAAKLLQNRVTDQQRELSRRIDRKLRRKIDLKKQAQGLRQE